MSHVTHMNESCHTYEGVMSQIRVLQGSTAAVVPVAEEVTAHEAAAEESTLDPIKSSDTSDTTIGIPLRNVSDIATGG